MYLCCEHAIKYAECKYLTDIVVLGGIGDVQQSPDLLLPYMGSGATRRQCRISKLQIVYGLVVLKSTDEVVAMELARIVAERVQGQAVLGEFWGGDRDLMVSERSESNAVILNMF